MWRHSRRTFARWVAPANRVVSADVYWCRTRTGYGVPSPCSKVIPTAPIWVVGTVSPYTWAKKSYPDFQVS